VDELDSKEAMCLHSRIFHEQSPLEDVLGFDDGVVARSKDGIARCSVLCDVVSVLLVFADESKM